MRSRFLFALATAVVCARSASAVPMGTGQFLVEVSQVDGSVCGRADGFNNQTYDVFGTNVNLSTDLGDLICMNGHCQSYPSSSLFAFDVVAHVLCTNPPGCTVYSFVSDPVTAVTGSLSTTLGAGIDYTADGEVTIIGGAPAPTIPNCSIPGPVGRASGTIGVNAFQGTSTPVGTDQTVTIPDTTFFNPITGQEVTIDVGITFGTVTDAGITTVIASSNASATIPANFAAAVNGFNAAFLEIRTTATIVPPIEVCSTYEDADDDGFVDGTSPPIPESALSFMHGEGEPKAFVDRTSSRDPVENIICALVDSLSPFVVAVRTNGICAALNDPCDDGDACTLNDVCNSSLECVGGGAVTCDDGNVCTSDTCVSPQGCTFAPEPATGCNVSNGKGQLLIKDNADDSKDQLMFQWQKGSSPLSEFGDPTATTSYTLCAFDANRMLASATVPPAGTCGTKPCWKFLGTAPAFKGVKYGDSQKPPVNDGMKSISSKADTAGKAKLILKAAGLNLPSPNIAGVVYPVTVQVRTNDAGCWEEQFTSADEKKNDGIQFKAVHVEP